ncbi:ArsR/SmtB family transcription factor [Salinibacter altiplanensis]|uniref:ArsR/SmtB family transcription factor n=1 Tax=Salinibacter altiplanensis TaxID=1803181 RepID=UPI000C9EE6BB|nr:metalloregulator ArsR/SmtB family transcription factor [Salinibacter altiplanensis]
MPSATRPNFTETDRRLAQTLKALAHPARLAIVRLLADRDECVCGEIVDDLPLAQSTVSQHLKALKEVGLVQGTVEGRSTCYCIAPEALAALKTDVDGLFDGLSLSTTDQNCC